MAAKQGDFLLLNYTLRVKESGETVDTTFDTIAKTSHIHKEDTHYGPKFVILGEGWIPKGLEESLVGMDPGKSATVELSPEKGYGVRDPSKMRLFPMRRFREKGMDPIPGAQIEFDGRAAVVRAVGAGRVQVDYNHPLAGRTLVYDISIEKVLEDDSEKIVNIISRRIPEVPGNRFVVEHNGANLTLEIPEEAFYISGLQIAKKSITSDLQKYFPNLDSISFRETFKKPAEKRELLSESTSLGTDASTKEEKLKDTESLQTKQVSKRRRGTAQKPSSSGSYKSPKAGSENQR